MAIAFVQEVGAAGNAGATTIVITVGPNTTVGNHLILAVGTGGSGLSSVADSKGNTWQVDLFDNVSDPRAAIASAKITTQLVTGDTITATLLGSTFGGATATEWSGLDPTAWFDLSAVSRGTGTATDSTATATTSQADELLYGVLSHNGSTTTYTPEVLSPVWDLRTNVSSTGTIRTVVPMSRVVAATGAYAAKITLGVSKNWSQLIATYKAAAAAIVQPMYDPIRVPNKWVGPPVLRRYFVNPFDRDTPPVITQAPAEVASATAQALDPSKTVAVNAGLAAATGAALAPTVTSGTIAPAGLAAATGAALAPTVEVKPSAGLAAATGAALGPNKTVIASAGLASATAVARQPTIATGTEIRLWVGNIDSSVDVLDHVRTATLKVKATADRRNSTMDVTLVGTPTEFYGGGAGTRLITEHLIAFVWGSDTIFGGVIRSVTPVDAYRPGHIALQVACQDYTFVATDSICNPSLDTTVRTVTESDAARIQWLFDTFSGIVQAGALITPDAATYVKTIVASMPAQDFTGLTVGQAMDEICKITGGTWWIDMATGGGGSGLFPTPFVHYRPTDAGSKSLTTPFGVAATDTLTSTSHGLSAGDAIVFPVLVGGTGLSANGPIYYVIASGLTANAFKVSLTPGGGAVNFTTDVTSGAFIVVDPAPFGLSDTPDNATTYSYDNLVIKTETTEYRTGVVVIGGEGYVGTFGNSNGRLGVIKDDTITDATTAGLAADAYLEKNQVGVEGSVKYWHSGLDPGMVVQITSTNQLAQRGQDPEDVAVGTVFRITGVDASYDKLQSVVSYKATLGRVPRLLHTAIRDIAKAEAELTATKVVNGVLAGYVGEIIGWPLATPPTGFLICDGSSLLRAGTYARLFSVLGTTFGSVDGTHFNVPDLRGRFPIGVDGSHALGSTGGSANHTHTGPSHTHTGPSHSHSHSHAGPSHTHTGPSHSHSHSHIPAAHDHGGNTAGHTAGFVTSTNTGSFDRETTHLHAISADGNTATDTDATTGGTGATGSSGTGSTDTDATTGGTGATGSSGTGATGSADPPYIAIHYAIRYA